jgi:biopolymer transport protein ExbD
MRKLIATLFATALLLSPQLSPLVVKASDLSRAKGSIRAVDLRANTVTIATRNDGPLVLLVNNSTQITRNGERATLADLQSGDRATVHYDLATLLAQNIEARGDVAAALARIEGTISNVDTNARTFTVAPVRGGSPVTLNVKPNTEITLDGRPASFTDLARGFTAAASYNTETLDAVRVNAESFAEVRGTIRDVGFVEHTLTITPSTGEPAITLIVSPGTPISLNDRPATLDDLRRGYQVVASFVATTHAAVRIAANSTGEVTGHIRAVDSTSALVVIAPLVDGPPVELHVTHSTVITIGGAPASFDRLQVGMAAKATYHITTFDALAIEARPLDGDVCTRLRVKGAIADVSLHASSVTIDPASGDERLTLSVVPRTEITINDRPARLDDLRAGMRVVAHFCRETLVATSIAARANP